MATEVFNETIANGANSNTTGYELAGMEVVTFYITTNAALTGTVSISPDNGTTYYRLWEPDASGLFSYSLTAISQALQIAAPGATHIRMNLANASGGVATVSAYAQRASALRTSNAS